MLFNSNGNKRSSGQFGAQVLVALIGALAIIGVMHHVGVFDSSNALRPSAMNMADRCPDAAAQRMFAAKEAPKIQRTIRAQIAAFRRNDYRAAMTYAAASSGLAAPSLRAIVTKQYPQLTHVKRVTFYQPVRGMCCHEEATQTAMIVDDRGKQTVEEYSLMKEAGRWKIIGVRTACPACPGEHQCPLGAGALPVPMAPGHPSVHAKPQSAHPAIPATKMT